MTHGLVGIQVSIFHMDGVGTLTIWDGMIHIGDMVDGTIRGMVMEVGTGHIMLLLGVGIDGIDTIMPTTQVSMMACTTEDTTITLK